MFGTITRSGALITALCLVAVGAAGAATKAPALISQKAAQPKAMDFMKSPHHFSAKKQALAGKHFSNAKVNPHATHKFATTGANKKTSH